MQIHRPQKLLEVGPGKECCNEVQDGSKVHWSLRIAAQVPSFCFLVITLSKTNWAILFHVLTHGLTSCPAAATFYIGISRPFPKTNLANCLLDTASWVFHGDLTSAGTNQPGIFSGVKHLSKLSPTVQTTDSGTFPRCAAQGFSFEAIQWSSGPLLTPCKNDLSPLPRHSFLSSLVPPLTRLQMG